MQDKNTNFFFYIIRKIKENINKIILIITTNIFIQLLIVRLCKDKFKDFFLSNYLKLSIIVLSLIFVFFIGVFLYLFDDNDKESLKELKNIDCLQCSKRNVSLLSPAEYKKNMNIYSISDLEEIEKNIDEHATIWVFTSDVELETTKSSISSIMKINLKRGVTYIYFIPPSIKNEAKIMELERDFGQFNNLKIIKLSSEYKLLFEKFDVIIYSPDRNYIDGKIGFICTNFSNDANLLIFKKFAENDLMNLIGQLKKIYEEYNENQQNY